jgi:transcriptional regulator with XRE-family HTH domain
MEPMDSRDLYGRVGALIKNQRRSRGLSQQELAITLGMSRASLANIETGRQSLLLHHLYSIAASLEINIADLMPRQADLARAMIDLNDLPLPAGLKPEQRDQIARVLRGDALDLSSDKDKHDGRTAKRRRR